jgi:hypothetical protein
VHVARLEKGIWAVAKSQILLISFALLLSKGMESVALRIPIQDSLGE